MNFSKKMKKYAVLLASVSLLLLNPCISSAKIGIIVALNGTTEQIRSAMKISHTRQYAQREFFIGTLSDIDIVLTRSPMGMINNAITTQVLILQFDVQQIISIAPAGGLADQIKIGDLVIANQVWQHDFGTIKPYGFIWGKTPDGSGSHSLGYQQLDEKMLTVAKKTSDGIAISGNHFHEGIIAGGDSFIADNNKKLWIAQKFDAVAVDMGSAAIAQVCFANKIPCLILRMITDKADINARVDFAESLPSYRSTIDISNYLSLLLAAFAQ
jgi:5'-methylthioadenosine/S-adenosylhomocysteine nucleosidase